MTDFPRLLTLLTRSGVEFIVIGGFAATAHGSAHVTVDLDLSSNLPTQELKSYLGGYLRTSPRSPVKSLEELLASGLHAAQWQGFLGAANAVADDYLAGDDYRSRFAAREARGRAILTVMDASTLDALAYPTVRRIAPLAGGNQIGSNAGLSAQTGGVAHILAKSPGARSSGVVTLTTAEAADLRAGKLYVAAVSAKDPRLGARGTLVLP